MDGKDSVAFSGTHLCYGGVEVIATEQESRLSTLLFYRVILIHLFICFCCRMSGRCSPVTMATSETICASITAVVYVKG